MSQEVKRAKQEKGSSDVSEKVVVAVKASKEIPKTALVWALTHVVQPGDCITLLVVVPSHSSGIFLLPYLIVYCLISCSRIGVKRVHDDLSSSGFFEIMLPIHLNTSQFPWF